MINYTFVIPHKNSPDLLLRCINSIPQRIDIEIIVVDDNSPIDRIPTIERTGVNLIQLGEKESNGAGHARNVGLSQAKGKWLLFADSDDYYENGFIDILDKSKDEELDILYFRYYNNDGINKTTDTVWTDLMYDNYINSSKTKEDIMHLGLATTSLWNKMYSHKFITSIGCCFEEIPMGNDAWFVNYAGVHARKIKVINDRLYDYLQIPSGITLQKRPLSHHKALIESDKKRNVLKRNAGCYDLLLPPGFNKDVVIRDFGRMTYYFLFLKRFFTEYLFFIAVVRAAMRRLHIIPNIIITNAQD